jgi:hypothetical protein
MSLKPMLLCVEEYQREREGTPDTAGCLLSRPRGDSGCRDITVCPALEVNLRVVRDTSLQASLINSRAARERPPLPFNHHRSCLSLRNEGENLGCLEPLCTGVNGPPVGNRGPRPCFFCLWEKVETKKVQTAVVDVPRFCSRTETQVRAALVAIYTSMFHRSLFWCHLRLRVITHSGRDR